MNADDSGLARVLALYRDCCAQSGIDPLDDDEARELARKFRDLLVPAFEREFRLHDPRAAVRWRCRPVTAVPVSAKRPQQNAKADFRCTIKLLVAR